MMLRKFACNNNNDNYYYYYNTGQYFTKIINELCAFHELNELVDDE